MTCSSIPRHQGKVKSGGHFRSITVNRELTVPQRCASCLLPGKTDLQKTPVGTRAWSHITCWGYYFVLSPPTYSEGPAILWSGSIVL